MSGPNRFSDRLKIDRMKAYTQDTTVAEGIVQNEAHPSETLAEEQHVDKKDKLRKADPKGSASENKNVANERIMAYASSKQRKVANSVTLSSDVVTAINQIVSQLKEQGFENTNKSTVMDELLREKLTDLGLI